MKHTPKRPNLTNVKKLLDRARMLQARTEELKEAYRELDSITIALIPFQAHLPRYGAQVTDNFATKNTAFKMMFISRYKLEFGPKGWVPGTTDKARGSDNEG